jgi:hypothetical protein
VHFITAISKLRRFTGTHIVSKHVVSIVQYLLLMSIMTRSLITSDGGYHLGDPTFFITLFTLPSQWSPLAPNCPIWVSSSFTDSSCSTKNNQEPLAHEWSITFTWILPTTMILSLALALDYLYHLKNLGVGIQLQLWSQSIPKLNAHHKLHYIVSKTKMQKGG